VSLSLLALSGARAASAQTKKELAGPIEFIEEPWGLGMRLFPVQRVILKAHYGVALDDTERFEVTDWTRTRVRKMTEKEYLSFIYNEGRSNIGEVIPGRERREMILSVGRRSGKTTVSACISAYETYKLISKGDPQAYYGVPSSNMIQLISVATDKEQAGLLYQEVSGHYSKCAFFAPYMANNTMSYARFQTPADISRYGSYVDNPSAKATIKITFRSCVAKGLRGAGNIVVILDEVAHFTDSGQSSADSVYEAVTPSTSAYSPKDPNDRRRPISDTSEARIILISSPLGRQGLFYKMFQMGMGGGKVAENMLCVQAPTWEVNPTVPGAEFEKHYLKNVNVFFTEYGGEFTDRTRGWIEEARDLRECVVEELRPAQRGLPRVSYFMGVDLGLAGDGTAVAVGHADGDGHVVVDLVDQIKAKEGKYVDDERLEFDAVADWIKDICGRFLVTEGMFDTWSGIPFEQALAKRGLGQLKSENMKKELTSQMFANFKNMMWDRRLRLYNWPLPSGEEWCPYLKELLELQAEHHSKYLITVAAPNTEGKHDDMSDALVRMVWLVSKRLATNPHFGSAGMSPLASGMPPRPLLSTRRRLLQSGSVEARQIQRGPGIRPRGWIR
jgi:hypothetical protein